MGILTRTMKARTQVHLVSVEVGVVWSTYALVEAERPPWSNSNLVSGPGGEGHENSYIDSMTYPVTHDRDLVA